jgi:hypothetical protein
MTGRRRARSGQALIETAVTLPILILLFFGFLAGGVAAQGYVDLNTAVYLAAASNATAYANDQVDADRYATETFDATLAHDPFLVKQYFRCGGSYLAGGTVTCEGQAVLHLSNTVLGFVVPRDPPPITIRASAVRSRYRSEKP